MSKPRISILAGAGISMDADLPSSVGLAKRFKEALTKGEDIIEGVKNSLLEEVLRFLNGGIRFQRGFCKQDPDVDINIEELATAAQRLRDRLSSPVTAYVSGWHSRLAELERDHPMVLEAFTDAIYDKLGEWLATPPLEKIDYLTRIWDLVTAGYEVNYFTLNYDLLFEAALEGRKYAFVNGMTDQGEWKPELFEGDGVKVFKLHGSLDWVDHEIYGVCSLSYPRHSRAEEFEGAQKPLIIFGTDQKLTSRDPFLTLLYRFSTEIKKSDVCIIIGYSFGDPHLNDVLIQRMRENLRVKVLVVHPQGEAIADKLPALQDNPRVKFVSEKALAALNTGVVVRECKALLAETEGETPF